MPRDHLDALDPRFPIALTSEAPLFWSSLRPWWSHSSAFAMAESERAGKQAGRREEAFIRAVSDYETAELRERFAESVRNHPPQVPRMVLPADDTQGAVRWSQPPAWADDTTLDASEFLAEPLEPLPEMTP